jgi:hypothetical protein
MDINMARRQVLSYESPKTYAFARFNVLKPFHAWAESISCVLFGMQLSEFSSCQVLA